MSTTLPGGSSPASSGVTAKPVALVQNKRSRNNKNSGVGSTLEIVHCTIDPANASVRNATILNTT